MNDILIGTSGYDYPEWKGIFYPENLKREDFLPFYATQFNALEINNTFYNMPNETRMRRFCERTDGKLQFSIKANKALTHEIGKEWKRDAEFMRLSVNPMHFKGLLSGLLFQFPQSFHYTPENRYYLAHLMNEFEGYPLIIEIRHSDWIRESVFEGFTKRNASIVFCDMPQLKNLPDGKSLNTPFVGPNAYIRLHGRNANAWYSHNSAQNGSGRYDYYYSDEELEEFIPVIQTAKEEGRKVQVYFNNHPRASGAKNAGKLAELLRRLIEKGNF